MEQMPVSGNAGTYTLTDIVRFFLIAALAAMIACITFVATLRDPATIAPQLFFIPILYGAYFYPRSGVYIAGACAIVYELIGAAVAFPDPVRAMNAILQGVLFVVIGSVITYLAGTLRAGTEECNNLKDEVARDRKRRRGIVTTVAHELRTPLQPLMGYLNLLLSDPAGFGITTDTEKILARCLTSVERERQIINQMLEFSILEEGRLRLDYSVFSVRDLLDSLISSQGYASDAEVTMEIPDGLTFNADATRIGTVIGSILSNAVTYSRPPRRIRITSLSSERDGFHRLAISDNGVGIAKEQLGSIFEPFQLADSEKLSRKYERIGLSLAIARQYLRMHGGDITVASTINAGTTFTIHIPKDPGAGEACG